MTVQQTYWDLVAPIWDSVSIYDGGETFLAQFRKVTPKQQLLFATHWAWSEIRNGGLLQFYSNSTGVLAPEAETGFKMLGMLSCSHALNESMGFFGEIYPRDRDVREDKLVEYEVDNPDAWDPFEVIYDNLFDKIVSELRGYKAVATQYAFPQ